MAPEFLSKQLTKSVLDRKEKLEADCLIHHLFCSKLAEIYRMTDSYKLIVHVPLSHTLQVRQAMGDAGAGRIGNYTHCSFSTTGTGRYKGNDQSKPFIGEAGRYEQAEEERIEVTVAANLLARVVAALKAAHPYDEPTYDIFALVDIDDLPPG